jgi:hypothetical protein
MSIRATHPSRARHCYRHARIANLPVAPPASLSHRPDLAPAAFPARTTHRIVGVRVVGRPPPRSRGRFCRCARSASARQNHAPRGRCSRRKVSRTRRALRTCTRGPWCHGFAHRPRTSFERLPPTHRIVASRLPEHSTRLYFLAERSSSGSSPAHQLTPPPAPSPRLSDRHGTHVTCTWSTSRPQLCPPGMISHVYVNAPCDSQ